MLNKREIRAAVALRMAANEWPRCGEDWPLPGAEEAAQAFLDAHGLNELGRTKEEEEAIEASFRR